MSVMSQLKEFASNPSDGESASQKEFGREFLPSEQGLAQNGELSDMIEDNPIPGQSLTQDPDQRMAYEGPPQITDQQEFADHLFVRLCEPEILPGVLQSMRKGIPIEDVTLKILRSQVQKGVISVDLMMLSIEPTIYTLIALATSAEIEAVLYPEGDFDEEESNDAMALNFRRAAHNLATKGGKEEAPEEGESITLSDVEAPAVTPKNLMSKSKAAVKGIE